MWYTRGGYAWMLLYTYLLGNETRILYGKIYNWYALVVLYEYILIYWTVVNTLGLLLPTHTNMWLQYLMTQRMCWTWHFILCKAILFCHLIRATCILYMAADPIFKVSNVLNHPSVTVSNIISMIRQTITTFSKPGNYIE